jgi:hypothetical protein
MTALLLLQLALVAMIVVLLIGLMVVAFRS